ncbi:MAG: hypothetical protein LBJ09_00295 [Clostridiales bacterium]|jgi:hypothetical protein|nr:hypothetical protein [Clostridiales bacterium]
MAADGSNPEEAKTESEEEAKKKAEAERIENEKKATKDEENNKEIEGWKERVLTALKVTGGFFAAVFVLGLLAVSVAPFLAAFTAIAFLGTGVAAVTALGFGITYGVKRYRRDHPPQENQSADTKGMDDEERTDEMENENENENDMENENEHDLGREEASDDLSVEMPFEPQPEEHETQESLERAEEVEGVLDSEPQPEEAKPQIPEAEEDKVRKIVEGAKAEHSAAEVTEESFDHYDTATRELTTKFRSREKASDERQKGAGPEK